MKQKTVKQKVGDLRVWWIPQIPGKSFTVDVESVQDAVKIMNILAEYDKFQFDNYIKPDYSNAGGLQVWCDDIDGKGNGGWEDWYDEKTDEDDPVIYLENLER